MNDHDDDSDQPRRMTAKFAGRCAQCLAAIEPGDEIVWEPARGSSRAKAYCAECGEDLVDG